MHGEKNDVNIRDCSGKSASENHTPRDTLWVLRQFGFGIPDGDIGVFLLLRAVVLTVMFRYHFNR